MKFVIAQKSSLEQKALLNTTFVNKALYASYHGYDTFLDTIKYNSSKLDKWMKIEAILKCFEKDCDWIFWSDADSVIMNFQTCLEDLVVTDKDLIMSKFPIDDNTRIRMQYDFEYALHAGNMIIKRSEWAYNFIKEIYSDEDYSMNLMSEEAAITARYRDTQEVQDKIYVHDLAKFCTVPYDGYVGIIKPYEDGDFIIHLLGYAMDAKIKGVTIYERKAAIKNEKYTGLIQK